MDRLRSYKHGVGQIVDFINGVHSLSPLSPSCSPPHHLIHSTSPTPPVIMVCTSQSRSSTLQPASPTTMHPPLPPPTLSPHTAISFCYLLRQPLILDFPFNTTASSP